MTTKWIPGKEPFEHSPLAAPVVFDGREYFRGGCSCGWRNKWMYRSAEPAMSYAVLHVLKFKAQRRPCGFCAVWTCDACGWKRHSANPDLSFEHHCAKFGSVDGTMTPTMHGSRRYWQHLPENN